MANKAFTLVNKALTLADKAFTSVNRIIMRVVIQVVKSAHVDVEGKTIAKIGPGLLLLVGIANGDIQDDTIYLANKCVNLRIFEDERGKMNVSALDKAAEILAISQFTLYADVKKGRRPGFTDAAPPLYSKPLFEFFVKKLRDSGLSVAEGLFGANMQVNLINNGPVTIILDSRELVNR